MRSSNSRLVIYNNPFRKPRKKELGEKGQSQVVAIFYNRLEDIHRDPLDDLLSILILIVPFCPFSPISNLLSIQSSAFMSGVKEWRDPSAQRMTYLCLGPFHLVDGLSVRTQEGITITAPPHGGSTLPDGPVSWFPP